jgi:hypothetical protein
MKCTNLSIDLSNLDISKAKKISDDYKGCATLNVTDISNWNLKNISKIVPLNKMNLNQIKFYQEKELFFEIGRENAINLQTSNQHVFIMSDIVEEFDSIK